MRAIRTAQFVAATLTLVLGTSAIAVPPPASQGEEPPLVRGVVGAVELDPASSYGAYAVTYGVHQHRDIPVTGPEIFANDVRLTGPLDATFNYDVYHSGKEPVPAWGTMSIADGAWTGTFNGLRRQDFEPFEMQAFLIGNGPFEGLCAVLDITAGPESWAMDGVIHPLPMGA